MPLFNMKNLFGLSPQENPFISVAGHAARELEGSMPIGMMNGHMGGHPNHWAMQVANWVKTLHTGTIATVDGDPTTVVLTTAATAHTGPAMQVSKDGGTTAWANFKAQAGKALWQRCFVQLDDVVNTAFVCGLWEVNTAPLSQSDDTIGIVNGIFFYKAAGAATLSAVLRAGSTSTSQTLTGFDMVNATDKKLGIRTTDGGACVEFWVDDQKAYVQSTLTNLPTANLALSMAVNTTTNNAHTATVKRVYAFKEAA